MKNRLLLIIWLSLFSNISFAQSVSCKDLIYEYDSGGYERVLNHVLQNQNSNYDGCYYNIAGLSAFKLPDTDNAQLTDIGLSLFSKSASLDYPAGFYNFYKYSYLNTNADLGVVLKGLSGLVAVSNNDKWRSSAVKAMALGNQIIQTCSGAVNDPTCRGRKVTLQQKAEFENSVNNALRIAHGDLARRNQEFADSKAVLDSIVLSLGVGLVLAPALSGGAAAAAATKPVSDPFLWSKPMPPIVTCIAGRCVVQ